MSPAPDSIEVRLLRLLDAARDDHDVAARATLNALLRDDATARGVMNRLLVDEQALIGRLREEKILAAMAPPGAVPRVVRPVSPAGGRSLSLLSWSAAAAIVVVSVLLWRQMLGSEDDGARNTSPMVAVLSEDVGAVWAGRGISRGSPLAAGRLSLVSGMASIEFSSGSRVLMEGPAELDLVSGMECRCLSGRLRVHVPPPAQGFTVTTTTVRVVDLGTTFALAVPKAGEESGTLLKVLDGKVRLESPGDATTLKEQEGGIIGGDGRFNSRTLPDEAFPSEADFARRLAVRDRERVARWESSIRELARDPAALVCYTFEETTEASRSVRNHVPDSNVSSHGSLVGAGWTTGRWPGKRALDFRGLGDRLLFEVPGELPAVTFAAWIRPDNLSNIFNALLVPDLSSRPSLQWMLEETGMLRLSMPNGVHDRGSAEGWDGLVQSPATPPDNFNQWMFIVATYDSNRGEVIQYRDGKEIGRGSFTSRRKPVLGRMSFGNWPEGSTPAEPAPVSRKRAEMVRNFTGRLDEMWILRRALTPGEVARLYEQGKP